MYRENEEEDEEIMSSLLHHGHHGGGNGAAVQYQYVKVKMEGVGIGRKIDLSLYNSYQSLTHSLINMFAKCKQHHYIYIYIPH